MFLFCCILWTIGQMLNINCKTKVRNKFSMNGMKHTLACNPDKLWLRWCGNNDPRTTDCLNVFGGSKLPVSIMSLCSSDDKRGDSPRADNELLTEMFPLWCALCCWELLVASFTSWNFSINCYTYGSIHLILSLMFIFFKISYFI